MVATTTPPSVTYAYRRPWLYPIQERAIFDPARYVVVEASTKSGKTVGCMVWLAEHAIAGGGPGRNYWWIAPIYAQAKIVFRRMKRALPREVFTANESELTLTLLNGAVIWFKGADNPDSLYGEDVYAAVIDEASRAKEEAWYAVRSTLTATRGPVRIIGNVKGRRNWAYQMARRAEAGAPDMAYFKITAADAVRGGVLADDEIADAKRQLPDAVYRELYEAEPSDDAGNPFGYAAIAACVADLSPHRPDAWGWDLAKSIDWTVGIALDERGATCQFERWQGPWEITTSRIATLTGDVPALVDSTGVGDPIVERLQTVNQATQGFRFSSHTKQQLMEGLAVALQQREITIPDGLIVTELEAFEYVYSRTGVTYAAPEGMTDDCVMALGLAVACWRETQGRSAQWGPAVTLYGRTPARGREYGAL